MNQNNTIFLYRSELKLIVVMYLNVYGLISLTGLFHQPQNLLLHKVQILMRSFMQNINKHIILVSIFYKKGINNIIFVNNSPVVEMKIRIYWSESNS